MNMRPGPRRGRSAMAVLAVALTGTLAACTESTTPNKAESAESSRPPVSATADSSLRMVSVHGRKLAFHVTPGRLPAIVLDAGGGEDSSEWKKIVPVLAENTGSEIITYDRAGLGRSDEVSGPWNAENAASDLAAGLTELGAARDVVLVSHSQAGEVSTYFTRDHPKWVSGAVLVDASLPGFYTDGEIAKIEAANKAQVAKLKGRPTTRETRQLLATASKYGPMHRAYHRISWPRTVPATVIVSSKTPFDTAEDARLWRVAQKRFAEAAPNRTLVVAEGSSHEVPADRPDIVVKTVDDMVTARG